MTELRSYNRLEDNRLDEISADELVPGPSVSQFKRFSPAWMLAIAVFTVVVLALAVFNLFGGGTVPENMPVISSTCSPLLAVPLEDFEPSGAVWHSVRGQTLVVSDNGKIVAIAPTGDVAATWNVGHFDFEGIAIADPTTSHVYLVDEETASIVEVDLEGSGNVTRRWNVGHLLPTWTKSHGLEGITFVPKKDDTASPLVDGVFYVANQKDGQIYGISVGELHVPAVEGDVKLVEVVHTPFGKDCSGLQYAGNGLLYAIFDKADSLVILDLLSSEIANVQHLPGDGQEGVTLVPSDDAALMLVVAEDSGGLWKYSFPILDSCRRQSS